MAFYIDHSLQFDTRDEYFYHESLFLPVAALAVARKKEDIHGLILGGGDGLGLREGLKFPATQRIDLVDYDAQIIQFAKTELQNFNKKALSDPRVVVHIQEAHEYLRRATGRYDYIVADFTFPHDLSGCSLFTRDFFYDLSQRLRPQGIFALNACSPMRSAEAFWSIYRTLSCVGLNPKPFQIQIPSFVAQGYGSWGFFLASSAPLLHKEIQNIVFPEDRQFITKDIFLNAMSFDGHTVLHGFNFGRIIHQPEDLLTLFNTSGIFSSLGGESIDFSKDMLPFEVWKYFAAQPEYIFFSMSTYWKERIFNILADLDWGELMAGVEAALVKHSKEKVRDVCALLQRMSQAWKNGEQGRETFQRGLVALLAVIILINMLCPDNAFSKGYHGGHNYSSNSSSESQINLNLIAPTAATAFYTAYWLNNACVPDRSGNSHRKLFFPSTSSTVKENVQEPSFFAFNDLTYLTEQGNIFQLIPRTQFFYRIATSRLILYPPGPSAPVLELALDQDVADSLVKDIQANREALTASITQLEHWLNWSQAAAFLVKDIANEKKELEKLKTLQALLDTINQNSYSATASGSLDVASLKLAPAVYITVNGNLIVKTSDGVWKDYVYRGFGPSGNRAVLSTNILLDRFFEELLGGAVQNLKPQDPLLSLINDKMNRR